MAGSDKILHPGLLLLALLLPPSARSSESGCSFETGVDRFRSRQHVLATDLFRDCIEADEQLPASYFYLGIMARDAGDLGQARDLLGQAVSLNPGNITYRLEWAVTHEWLGELKRAASIYAEVLEAGPANLPARLGSARMDHWQGHLRRSVAGYRSILQDHPGHSAAQSGLAFALLADNKPAESRALFEKLLTANPADTSAREGLDMLADLRTRRWETSSGVLHDAAGQEIAQYRVAYAATPSYAIKWGAELVERENFASPPNNSGVSVNRAVKASQTLFMDYRLSARTSAFMSWRREELPAGKNQNKLHLELMHKPSVRHRLFAGAIPAYISGKRVNLLSYAGYVYEPDADWSAMAQLYYGWDRDFAASRALSLSWNRNYGKRNFLRLGASLSETSGERSESLYASGVHYFTRELAIRAGLVNNLSNEEREITLGVIYEF